MFLGFSLSACDNPFSRSQEDAEETTSSQETTTSTENGKDDEKSFVDKIKDKVGLSDDEGSNFQTKEGWTNIIFLHHSTGENIWNGGVSDWFKDYNSKHNTQYFIVDQIFPQDSPYGWNNYPYDYWNIWVNHGGDEAYKQEPTLEILTHSYDVVVWKHCFPVGEIQEDSGNPDISSEEKTIENYKLQYEALKSKMKEFPDTKFIAWTGAALVQGETDQAQASRTKEFFNWVKDDWDEKDDNIFLWDFYEIETEGGLYMKNTYAENSSDSHPNASFAQTAASLFGQRVVDVIQGKGDSGSLTGR